MEERMEISFAMEAAKHQEGGKALELLLELGEGLECLNVFFKNQREWSLKGL